MDETTKRRETSTITAGFSALSIVSLMENEDYEKTLVYDLFWSKTFCTYSGCKLFQIFVHKLLTGGIGILRTVKAIALFVMMQKNLIHTNPSLIFSTLK